MAMTREHEERTEGKAGGHIPLEAEAVRREARAPRLTGEQVWRAVAKESFAVIGYVTPSREPRSSGVMFKVVGRRLYLVVARESWKARHISANGKVSVTVPVRRGGILSLMAPIPPATVSFHGVATVHPAGSADHSLPKELASLLPPERRSSGSVIEVAPEGAFVTYGLGVSLMKMRDPAAARARVPVPIVTDGGGARAT